MPYSVPDDDIVEIIDAPPPPLSFPAPGGRFIAMLQYEAHPPVSLLARPFLRLAGIRLEPGAARRRRTMRCSGLSVIDVASGAERRLELPWQAQVSVPVWAADGERFAFTIDEPDGTGVWTAGAVKASAARVPGLRVRDVLGGDPPGLGGTVRWSRDGRTLLVLGNPPAGDAGAAGSGPRGVAAEEGTAGLEEIEPRIEETAGKRSQMATFQDLLRTDAGADRFDELATTVPLRADPVTGAVTVLGPPGLYRALDESPDGRYLIVHRLIRPFSFRVPYPYFARRAEIWSAEGGLVRVIADLPVSDEVPRMGVPEGPRRVGWDERSPARVLWTEALDGGDPMREAEHRDAVWSVSAPFTAPAGLAFMVTHRCLGWVHLDEPDTILLTEHDRDRRWLTTWIANLGEPERNRVLLDISEDDAYGDPGSPMMRLHPDGTRTVLQDGTLIYLRGDGATADGDRPFLDRFDLATAEKTRLYHCPDDAYEAVLGFAENRRDQVLIWHETPAEPPNLRVAGLGAADPEFRALTTWPDPHPQLTGLTRRLVVTDRGDGVSLSGMLYLPPGYQAERDGRLPLVIWAYPLDFGDAGTAGQIRGSSQRFTRLAASEPAWFVLRGYAVLADATIPVIGDPETKNDTYIEQITAAAAAHIAALDRMGIADPARVAVSGHSYGAFMTANLLAHTGLFAAGIARSGAYNRTLTPFGFQTERRSFWEVPAIYDQLSPFRYADRIKAPLLLIHGEDDGNSGTFPVQSERLFQAIQGTGGTARLVTLPFEEHGYRARESVLHVLAEQFSWLGRWLGRDPSSEESGA